MSKYFIPKLDPSQVVTASEYLVAHDQEISFAIKESVIEADHQLSIGERVKFAVAASFIFEENSYPGIVMVTAQTFYCCSSVSHNLICISIPYSQHIDVGPMSGSILKKLLIQCENVSVEIKSTAENLTQLTRALEGAISAATPESPTRHSTIIRQSADQYREIEKIKKAHRNERQPAKSESNMLRSSMNQTTKHETNIKKEGITVSEFKFCQHCGEKIDKECVVCPKCGKQVADLKTEQPNIIINNSNTNTNVTAGRVGKEKNKWVAFLLCLFLGGLGVHRFYEGKIGTGILWLFTGGLCGIGWLIDLIIILTKPNPYYV